MTLYSTEFIAKAVLSSALTVAWKLRYAMKFGLLPLIREISGLAAILFT
jgi:hypothetical protein